jgi:Fur family ferric uptake transcriptional regulator
MSYPEIAIKLLKSRGYRHTQPRQTVLEILDSAGVSLSPYDILDKIREIGKKGDVVSIYRILQTLEENGIVHRVISSGKYRKCHLSDDMDSHSTQNHCHHNLVCRSCSSIEEINCQGMNLIEQVVSSQSMFEIESHALEFYGICKNCKPLI